MSRSVRSRVPLVLTLAGMLGAAGGGGLAGCSNDRAAPAQGRVVATLSSAAAPSATAAAARPPSGPSSEARPTVQVMPDGSLELRPRITDVSMLERQADGSYRRKCGKPSDEVRTTMEQAMPARRGIK